MPSRSLLAPSPSLLVILLLLLLLLFGAATGSTNPYHFLGCDPETTPCAKPEEGTSACTACSFAPHSSACQTAYKRQPAIYCGNSTARMTQQIVSSAACCPVVLEATPTQCVPVEYNVTFGGSMYFESFTCRGKSLPVVPVVERPLLKTGLALVGVVAPICLILAVYALCRRYRGHHPLCNWPSRETLVDGTEAAKGSDEVDISVAAATYEMPVYRPDTFHAEGEMVAFALTTRSDSDDSSHVY